LIAAKIAGFSGSASNVTERPDLWRAAPLSI
jgi:hypothetical protein